MLGRLGSYAGLLRRNAGFRRLWLGQVVSQLGDWFNSIALYTLVLKLTGSGEAVGGLILAQFLPSTLLGLSAGALVDRLPRKAVMVGADLGRAAVVLLFLLVRDPADVWLLYAATVGLVALTSFFEPARSASISSLVPPEDLVLANGLAGATWSAVLALGAALGGVVTDLLGVRGAFILDSASYALSALILAGLPLKEEHLEHPQPRTGMMREALAFLRENPSVGLYASVKGLWSLGGGIMLLLTLFGQRVFPLGRDGALSIGLLYAARGLGAGLGPLLAHRFGGESTTSLRRYLGPAFLCTGLGYYLLGQAPALGWGLVAVGLAHIGGSIQWVYSSALLQLSVPNRLQGRIFSLELAAYTLTLALSNYLVGRAADEGISPQRLAEVMALCFCLPGLVLGALLWRRSRSPERRGGP